jgi:hypothetical protein
MKMKQIIILFVLLAASSGTLSHAQDKAGNPAGFSAGVMTGYYRGFGLQANITAHQVAREFPFKLRLGIGCTFLDPGNSADARRIFINNATDGVPEKKGRAMDYRIDFLLPAPIFGVRNSYIVFGPRFSTFRGNFKYVGGNEDFDVTSKQWGIGGSLEHHFGLSGRMQLVIGYGLDHFFPGTLTGHDTSYSPLNDNVNPQNDNQNDDEPFTYRDADKAIRQPMFMPRVMIGIEFAL